jgi:type IV pilus assembly protein PilY1
MKRLKNYWFTSILFLSCLIFMCNPGFADDTCIFMVTADDVPPNIVLLLDNGAEMEQVVWYSGYNNSTDYTPATDGVDNDVDGVIDEAGEDDVVGGAGNGFFNDNGYGIVKHGGSYYLVKVLGTLELGDYSNGLQADSGSTWTINGLTVTLPAEPSTVLVDGVIDNANRLRYSKNYLNWIFFSIGEGSYVQESTVSHDGSDLPNKSRFYYAKKALLTVARLTSNKAKFGIYNFTSTPEGASNVQPLGMVVNTPLATLPENNTLDSSFVNNINNMGTVTYSPLAEGLAQVGGYYASSSSHVVGEYCQKSFVIVVSPGVSSEDQGVTSPQYSPSGLSDYDGDDAAGSIGEGNIKADTTTYTIPTNQNGSTYLDDAAHYLYTNDIVDYQDGFQNVFTYTIGFMGNQVSNLFLINTSNNGNGNVNLYDTTDPKYGRYHYEAEDPDSLSSELLDAINDIISRTSSFTAPVVPVTRSMSGNRNYMAFKDQQLYRPGCSSDKEHER